MTAGIPRYRVRLLHLTAIWAYGVTQPMLALVDGNPDLLIATGASRLDLVLFAVLVAVAVPALLLAYCWLVSRLSPWAGDMLYLVTFGTLLAPLTARAVKLLDPAFVVALGLVALLAASGIVLYARSRAARLFVGYSIVLPVVAAAAFIHGLPTLTEDAEAARSDVEVTSPAPVVLFVLDELPAASLMTRRGEVDAARYPTFARLTREGTWYPNATTVHEWTSDALPALVTGRIGRKSTLPTSRYFPENLFSLLGDSYTMFVHESKTRLCHDRYCPKESRPATEVVHGLALDTARLLIPRILPESFASRLMPASRDIQLHDDAVVSIGRCEGALDQFADSKARRSLLYCHLMLPHAPWQFLPSGRRYEFHGMDGWLPSEHWTDEPWLVLQGHQRHLLQLGYVDRLLGRMLRRLERSALYDSALVVVVADHGASFRAGEARRVVTEGTLADVANVPLFLKHPRQRQPRVDERPARTIDVVPTIADVLGVRIPWEVQGDSLLGPLPASRGVVVDQRGGSVVRAPLARLIRERSELLRRQYEHFGEGRNSLFRIGTNRSLLGSSVDHLPRHSTTVSATIDNAGDLSSVRRSSGFVPARIFGHARSGSVGPDAELAVAVNGRIQALTRVFARNGQQLFRAMVPETSLRDGANEVEVFLIRGTGNRASLAPIASTSG